MVTITKLEIRLLRGHAWLLMETPETSAQAMFDAYMRSEHLSCCSIQGGLFIDLDGKAWSDERVADDFHLTQIWFEGVLAMMRGADSFGPAWGPTEELAMTWKRVGNEVQLGIPSLVDMLWAVTLDLPALARGVAARGRVYASWARDVRALARSAIRMPRTAKRARIVDAHLPSEPSLATIDELVAMVQPP